MATAKEILQYFRKVLKNNPSMNVEHETDVAKINSEPHSVVINVDLNSDDPTTAWQRMRRTQTVTHVLPIAEDTPISKDKLRCVCISDTHGKLEQREDMQIPNGDVLLHAGDFTMCGSLEEIQAFNEYIGQFPHKYKVVIAGNHETQLDKRLVYMEGDHGEADYMQSWFGVRKPRELLSNCLYLEEEMVQIAGIQIYGTPWSPEYASIAFSLPRGQALLDKWNHIPETVDILMTHCPPVGIGDLVQYKMRVGCVELLHTVQRRVKPTYHVFGHIHEGYGMYTDGSTTYINASTCTNHYKPINRPIVFDIDIPQGHRKDEAAEGIICCPCSPDSES